VLEGVGGTCLVLVNSRSSSADLASRHGVPGRVVALDVSAIALEVLEQHLLSAPMAAFVVRATALAPWDALERALRVELADSGLTLPAVDANVRAARRSFEAAPALGLPEPSAAAAAPPARGFDVPHLPAWFAAPAISVGGTSALRTTAGWRVWRPVIDLARCTRCFLCFALCPEGAIQLDADNWPAVDYAHCKGCLVCVEECPVDTIAQVREA
jgi:pyruvate ferredoxin oxidoreductase gamma subunit